MNLIHQIALTRINGVGPVTARQLLAHFGDAPTLFNTSRKDLLAIPGISPRLAEAILGKSVLLEAEHERIFIEKHSIQVLFWGESHYPKRLAECHDAPILLYYRGNADLNAPRIVSIVGTRNATPYGKSICNQLVRELLPYDVTVISGLAHGIDSHAHRNALAQGIPTVGILGHGLDRIYPAANREMAAKMLQHGGLLTEFPSGTNPERRNFPMRNRIIAGLADVTVVVEAATKGGALITAEIANTYNRDVCAFPGNLQQVFSGGCNHLIKTNRAHLITGAKDLGYLMNWEAEPASNPAAQHPQSATLNAPQQQVFDVIQSSTQVALDELSRRLQWPQSKLAITLLEMEIKGIIAALPGKVYRIV